MKLKSIVAAFVIAAVPVCARAEKPAAKVTNADAQKVVKMISADKAKTQIDRDMNKLGEQIDQADEKKDAKKVDELLKKMDDLSQSRPRIRRLGRRHARPRPDF